MRMTVVAALALTLAFTLGLITGAPSGETAGSIVRADLNGQPARLTLPSGDGQPKGLVMWFHGQGGSVNDRVDGPFLRALTRDGYAIASSSFHDQSWGNAASTEDAELLTAWAEEQTGLPVSLWVSGSMGASVSLNALLQGVGPPACWYGVKPAISLNRMDAVPAGNKLIALAYGGAVPMERNPVRNVAQLPQDVRYRVVASPDDSWVPLNENGGALVSQLDDRGVEVSYQAASGAHEDPSHFDSGDLLEFARSCDELTPGSDSASSD